MMARVKDISDRDCHFSYRMNLVTLIRKNQKGDRLQQFSRQEVISVMRLLFRVNMSSVKAVSYDSKCFIKMPNRYVLCSMNINLHGVHC